MELPGAPQKPLTTTQRTRVFGVVIDLTKSFGGNWQVKLEAGSRWKNEAMEVKLVIKDLRERHTISQS